MSEATDATNQAADQEIDAGVAEGVDAQGENIDLDTSNAADDGQAEDVEDLEDYELEGKTYKLPKSVIPQIMKNADYTQKTQRLSEEKRSLEQRAQAFAQQEAAHTELMNERVGVAVLKQQVDAYRNADWDAIEAADQQNGTNDYARHWRTYERLKEQLAGAEEGLKTKEGDRLKVQQQQAVVGFQETMRGLMDPVQGIPGFNNEKVAKIETLVKEFGLTTEDLVTAHDPRVWRVLNTLFDAVTENKALKAKQRHTASQQVKPATPVRGQGGKFTVNPDTTDFAAFEKQYG